MVAHDRVAGDAVCRMRRTWMPATHRPITRARCSSAGRRRASSRATRTPRKPTFTIALPPPNVTGELHMGHALNGSTQDTLIRLRRMQGFETEWICGTDHASIAVHAVIETAAAGRGH